VLAVLVLGLAADEPVALLELPGVVSPGEVIEASVVDPARTPPGGRWTVAGVEAQERDGRVSVRLPETLATGQPIPVQYHDPAGALEAHARAAVEIRPSPRARPQPALASASAHVVPGGEACVCGFLPPASWDALRLAGQPLQRTSASSREVRFRVPAGLTAGAHLLGGEARAGFRADRLVMRVVRLSGRTAKAELRRGQQTSVEIDVEGTEEPLPVWLDNVNPGVVSLDGASGPVSPTSGGPENRLVRTLHGRRRGDFLLHYRLELPSACACAEDPSELDTPPLFVPGRVLALVRPAPGDVPEDLARAIALTHALVVEAIHDLPLTGEVLVVLVGADDVRAKVAALQRDRRVRIAQPDYVHEVATGPAAGAAPSAYGPRLIGADRLPAAADGRGVTVGLIDTGVDARHPLLSARIAGQEDLTGQGLGPDVHGTMMAGAIAAEAGRDGLRGIAPGARLLVLKACRPVSAQNALAHCRSSALLPAVDRAATRGAQVLNLSVAGSQDEGLADRVREAERRGHIVVAAAGHLPEGSDPHPASLEEALAVTAVDAGAAAYPRATRGAFVDVAAPGVEVLTTVPGNGQAVCDGTSAAAAFVSGAMAVLRQHAPGLAPAAARGLVQRTARDLGPAGKDPQFGAGLLDLCRALAEASAGQAVCR
jgi:hypothetical protein